MSFLFLSSEKWGQKSERQIKYSLLSFRNLASKLTLRLSPVQLLDFLSLSGFQIQNCKSYIWIKTISRKPTRFPTFCMIHCLCEVKDLGSKSSWGEFFLQFGQLLSTLAWMSCTLAHAIHMHSSDTHAGEGAETDENVPIRMNGKTAPKLLTSDFWKNCNSYRPNNWCPAEQ